jgi:hypothetical protein
MIQYRSLEINRQGYQEDSAEESLIIILEWLAAEGYLQNNHWLSVEFPCSRYSPFVKVICSMKNLQILRLSDNDLTLEDLAYVFQSCSKITNLYISKFEYAMFEMSEHLKNQLRPGFQRLRFFEFASSINKVSWPVIQETLT